MKRKLMLFWALMGMYAVAFGGAATGNCMARAKALASSQAVTLVNEWEPEWKEYSDSGIYYYKVKLAKGQQYTIWLEGGNAADMDLSVDTDWEDENAPWATFEYASFDDDRTKVAWLYSDSWDEDDPSSGTYYVTIYGDIGAKATLNFSNGIVSFVKEGEEGNPSRIKMADTQQTHQSTLIGGEYYYSVYLEQGRKYRIRTTGGTSSTQLSLMFDASQSLPVDPDPDYTNDVNNAAYLVYPEVSDYYTFNVSAKDDVGFKVKYMSYPTRSPSAHPYTLLEATNDYAAVAVPGREVGDKAYYDAIIDEDLFRLTITNSSRWVFQTTGATNDLKLVVYAKDGTVLSQNTSENVKGAYGQDVRTAITATENTKYYVGVCRSGLEYWQERPTEGAVKIQAICADAFDGEEDKDEFDELDDTSDGATLLTPYPGADESEVETAGSLNGPHVLSGSDWYDWYKFPARKGVTYALKAGFATTATTALTLSAKVYKVVDGSLTKVATEGAFTPSSTTTSNRPLTFTADSSGMYYLRVSVAEGVSLDYPKYSVRALAYVEGAKMGLLQVNTKGVESTWYLSDDSSALYANGAVLALPVLDGTETYKIKFSAAGGYTTPPYQRTNTVYDIESEVPTATVVTGVYSDTADPLDDSSAGYTALTISNASAKQKRTLWIEDHADFFRFKAVDGFYYNFWLTDTTQGDAAGDAVFSITSTTGGAAVVSNVTEYRKKAFPAGKYFVTVGHGMSPAVDSCYRLYYSSANVGTIQFAATAVNTYENNGYVDLSVTRTASEGAVRVNYATVAGTAEPGREYYPANGILEWADGDMSTKTIRIRLIPDVVAAYEEARRFAVKLWPMTEDALAEDEYLATIAADTCTVKVKSADAAQPGTLKYVVASPSVMAGEDVVVRVARVDGSDGRIAVKLKTQNGSATNDVDYISMKTNLVWESGEDDIKEVVVSTIATDAVVAKQFVAKMSVLTTDEYEGCLVPTLEKTKSTITIGSELAKKEYAEVVAEAAKENVILSMNGSWYADAMGVFRCVAPAAGTKVKARFTVTGPGIFIVNPEIVDGMATLSCSTGGVALVCEPGQKNVYAVPAGETQFYFQFKGADGKAYLAFNPADNGRPYKFIPFTSVRPVEPKDLAVVGFNLKTLSWTAPAGVTSEGLWYRVRSKASTTSKQAKLTAVITNGTEQTSCLIPESYLAAGATYAWIVDYAYSDAEDPDFASLEWVVGPTVWHFSTVADDAPKTMATKDSVDVNGSPLAADKPIQLVEGVNSALYFAANGDAVQGRNMVVLSGTTPPGLVLKANKGRLSGVPSKAGDYTAVVQASGELPSTSETYDFHVAALGTGAGAFRGTLKEDGSVLTNKFPRLGSLTFSATAAGVLSAKAKIGNASLQFSSTTGYDELVSRSGDEALKVKVQLENVQTVNAIVYTNKLTVTIDAGSETNLMALGQIAGMAELVANIPTDDGLGVQEDIVYACSLYRNNAASEAHQAMMENFAGYYTMTLIPDGVSAYDGVPCGNGYLTATVSSNGSVLITGKLADGTDYSASSVAQLVGDLSNASACSLHIPFVVRVSPYSFGGVLKIDWAEPEIIGGKPCLANTVDSLTRLEWNKDGKYSSYDRQGFSLELQPAGGWYNTIVNLQAYYLNFDFEVEAGRVDGLPAELLPAGYDYTVNTIPYGVAATFTGDVLTTESRELMTVDGYTALALSVNPWKVKTSFERATGILTGNFKAWSDGEEQSQFATLNHYGILLMNRDDKSMLDDDVLTAGFYLMPVTSKWTLSMPFNVKTIGGTPDYRDWSEVEVPDL